MAITQIAVKPAERIDQLAKRAHGDPFQYVKLVEVNSDLNLFYPMPGQILTVKHD